jgi:hypothetical protein
MLPGSATAEFVEIALLLAAHQPPYDPTGHFLVVQDAPGIYSVVDSTAWTPVEGSLGTGALAGACALWHKRHAPTVRGLLAAPASPADMQASGGSRRCCGATT